VSRIFVIDDEEALGENVRRMLKAAGIEAEVFADAAKGLDSALADPPDAVLLDVRMPTMSGEEVFARLHESEPEVPVIFMTAYGSIEGAVLAMRSGALDYLKKPFSRDDLMLCVQRALAHRKMAREVRELRGRLSGLGEGEAVESASQAMRAMLATAGQVAPSDATVLLLGESGTGKELMARWIHDRSLRADGPFVAIDCTSLPPSLIESELFGHEKGAFTGAGSGKRGLIESAQGGTLFLDEIGDLPMEMQPRLLRFLEERQVRRVGGLSLLPVDCRILCATNQDLEAMVRGGRFREELFYRLAVVTLHLPPLRERPEDIPDLARHFLRRFARRYGRDISAEPSFYEALLRRRWTGNVRELKNTIERVVVLSGSGALKDGDVEVEPGSGDAAPELSRLAWREARERYLERFEIGYARSVLERCGGNVSAAAREAGVDRKTFYALLRRGPGSQGEE
jgi:DNA-binding NtrC family response regulator